MIQMDDVSIQKYLTPYKYGKPVLQGSGREGSFDSRAVDIPFVFFHRGQFHMMYVGFDGKGYQTALAVSDNLLDWKHKAVILSRAGNVGWDRVGAAGTWMIKESDHLFDLPTLKKIAGKYWLVYHSYPMAGYESGPAEIGLAWTEDEELLTWHRLEKPVFSWRDGADWEKGGLYKACIVMENGVYHMYYNAKTLGKSWVEQTGRASSPDLFQWTRCPENPLLPIMPTGWESKFLSDPCLVKDGDRWLNFYFAYDLEHAREGLALSSDMIHWEKLTGPVIDSGAPGEIDEIHAHKASVIYYQEKLYHFYCAVRPAWENDQTELHGEYRTITVACSAPF